MATTLAERNKQLVLKAFDTLFNQRNYEAAATMASPDRREGVMTKNKAVSDDHAVDVQWGADT